MARFASPETTTAEDIAIWTNDRSWTTIDDVTEATAEEIAERLADVRGYSFSDPASVTPEELANAINDRGGHGGKRTWRAW